MLSPPHHVSEVTISSTTRKIILNNDNYSSLLSFRSMLLMLISGQRYFWAKKLNNRVRDWLLFLVLVVMVLEPLIDLLGIVLVVCGRKFLRRCCMQIRLVMLLNTQSLQQWRFLLISKPCQHNLFWLVDLLPLSPKKQPKKPITYTSWVRLTRGKAALCRITPSCSQPTLLLIMHHTKQFRSLCFEGVGWLFLYSLGLIF